MATQKKTAPAPKKSTVRTPVKQTRPQMAPRAKKLSNGQPRPKKRG